MDVCVNTDRSVCAVPGQIIIADQKQMLQHRQEVVFSLGVLHCVDKDLKHLPHIIKTNS